MRAGKVRKMAVLLFAVTASVSLLLQGCGLDASSKGDAQKKETQKEDTQKEDTQTEETQKESTEKEESPQEVILPDSIRWFNASYAILTELNRCDYNVYGGMEINEANQNLQKRSLEASWEVTDRATADETLEWTLTEGHRIGFVEDMEVLKEAGMGETEEAKRQTFLLTNFNLSILEAQSYVDWYKMYEDYGEHAIDGWDYCRALNLLSFYYVAGYYTLEEALDKSLEIATEIQGIFHSWDELVDSYLRGYEYWAEESSDERREIYEDLKSREDNPYSVDFNTTLEKVW